MIKKFFLVTMLTLSWCNIGLANVIDLYCEFVTGTGQEKDEIQNYSITEYTVGDRYNRFIRGIKVKIDTSKKKIIDSPQDFNPDDGWKTIFSEDEIIWYLEGDGISTHYILNRYTGQLREESRIMTGDKKNDTFVVLIYKCSKAKRLF